MLTADVLCVCSYLAFARPPAAVSVPPPDCDQCRPPHHRRPAAAYLLAPWARPNHWPWPHWRARACGRLRLRQASDCRRPAIGPRSWRRRRGATQMMNQQSTASVFAAHSSDGLGGGWDGVAVQIRWALRLRRQVRCERIESGALQVQCD